MLDKSIPFAGIYMRREPGIPIQGCSLPDGFRFSFYQDGDETSWARIETSVLEFDSEFAAILLFNEKFMPHRDELYRRCFFVESEGGRKVATATAWWSLIQGQRRAWVEWVAVMPDYQGLGLGKAVIARVTKILTELEGDVPLYLHTQTWSHKAIGIYRACGYELLSEKALYRNKRDNYKKAMRILKRIERGKNNRT